jgi:hypothetical protein
MKGSWILSKAFSPSIEVILWFLSMILFICYVTFINYKFILTILISLEWNWLDHGMWFFWCVVGFGLQVFYWEFLYQRALNWLASNSMFFAVPLSSFRMNTILDHEFSSVPYLSISQKSLRSVGIISPLKIW